MKSVKAIAYSPYGAFELKRCYQRNMLLGTLISSSLAGAIIAAFMLAAYISGLNSMLGEEVGHKEVIKVSVNERPPPSIQRIMRRPNLSTIRPDFRLIGSIPNPVEVDEDFEIAVIPSRLERLELAASQYGEGPGGDPNGYIDTTGLFGPFADPEPDEFTSRDEEPVLLYAPVPEYPEIAQKAGIEAQVWIMVLIDTEGNVKKAFISKPSDMQLGFDEAALTAAWGRKYRPAMQNNRPVPVWVSYKVSFKIRD